MSVIGEITAIPKNQLSDDLEVTDHFSANGFEFKVLYKTSEKVIAEILYDCRSYLELKERVDDLEERIEKLEG